MAAPRPFVLAIATILATWFYVGRLGRAPGTWGSLAALPFAWALHVAGGPLLLAAAAILLLLVGIWASELYATATRTKDPSAVVIDEVAGQWLTLAAAALDPVQFLIGFLAFRAMDIAKPWPANWIDRHVSGGLGIMLDDIAAAIYAAGIVLLYRFLMG